MVLILIALVMLTILAVVMFVRADDRDSILTAVAGAICAFAAAVGLIAYVFAGWSYMAADYKADIINREYGTNYTQAEVYWAADVIDTVRELDRKRIELNGDLMNGRNDD